MALNNNLLNQNNTNDLPNSALKAAFGSQNQQQTSQPALKSAFARTVQPQQIAAQPNNPPVATQSTVVSGISRPSSFQPQSISAVAQPTYQPAAQIAAQPKLTQSVPVNTSLPMARPEYAVATRKSWLPMAIGASVAALSVVLIAVGMVYFVNNRDKLNNGNVAGASTADLQRIQTRIAELVPVPAGEQPRISQVADAEKVKSYNKEFFKDVKDGDYFVEYSNKVILYRSDSDQIIALGQYAQQNQQNQEKK